MPIIDSYTLVGSWPQTEVDLSLETLAAAMKARGVGRSLVTHTTAIFYNSAIGNDQAAQTCAPHAALTPVAVVNPLEYPLCLDEIDRRLGQGIQVFRLCPREHGYPFSDAVGPLVEVLERLSGARLLLVDLSGLDAPWIAGGLVSRLPVPTAFTIEARALGTLVHAARLAPEVWIETSALVAGGAVEAAVRHLGAERIVFGSGAPLRTLGAAVMSVQYAELPEDQRNAIFEGNVGRLLA